MSLASALEKTLEAPKLTPQDVAALEHLRTSVLPGLETSLRSRAGTRLTPDTSEWRDAVVEMFVAFGAIASALGPEGSNRFLALALDAANEDAVRVELRTPDVTRKLLMRQLERAIETLIDVLAALSPLSPDAGLSPEALEAAVTEMRTNGVPPFLTDVLSLELAAFVGLEASALGTEALQHWVGVAQGIANRLRVQLHAGGLAATVRVELAREKARHAWDDWTEDDVAEETAPWPTSA